MPKNRRRDKKVVGGGAARPAQGTTYNYVADGFHTGVTAQALRAKIDQKSAISLQRGHFDPKFHVERVAPHQLFLHG